MRKIAVNENRILYVVRHCKAEGQEPKAPLTLEGRVQAETLADFLLGKEIIRIVSSPFTRAIQSITPLAQLLNINIETDMRLIERILSTRNLDNWSDCLYKSFTDLDLSFEGGESNRMAMERAICAVQNILEHHAKNTVIVSHGNLMTLLLKYFDDSIGFETWRKLTSPDVFQVTITDMGSYVERIWQFAC